MGEEIRKERIGIELESREFTATKSIDRHIQPAQINPMLLDPKHDAKITETLENGVKVYCKGKPINECSKPERLEALLYTLRDPEFFGLKYVFEEMSKAKTVQNVFLSKEGDCDDMSRFYTVLAQRLGINDLEQLYVSFKEKNGKSEYNHAALLAHEGRVYYIDPAASKFIALPEEINSIPAALKSKKLYSILLGIREDLTKRKGSYFIEEIQSISGTANADFMYFFECGIDNTWKKNWSAAIEDFSKAFDRWLDTRALHSQMAQANFYVDNFEKAAEFYERAIKKKPTHSDYTDLGHAYFEMKNYGRAVSAFRGAYKLEQANYETLYELAVSLNAVALSNYSKGNNVQSLLELNEVDFLLKQFFKFAQKDAEQLNNANQLLESVGNLKQRLKNTQND